MPDVGIWEKSEKLSKQLVISNTKSKSSCLSFIPVFLKVNDAVLSEDYQGSFRRIGLML